MKPCTSLAVTLSLLLLGLFARIATADELAEKGRSVLEKHKSAVITLKLVIKQQFSMPGFGSEDQEEKMETTGTVLDASGLTVVSLTSTDPMSMYDFMMESQENDDFKVSSQLSDIKFVLADGKEISGQIVLRDKELDLAFIRPTEAPKASMAFVDFSACEAPKQLDPVVTINRLGRTASREYAVSIERIHAVVSKPRIFFVPGNDPTHSSLGAPAFTVDGAPIGILLMRNVGRGEMMDTMNDSMLSIILPGTDVMDVARQAPAAGEAPKEIGGAPEADSKDEKSSDSKSTIIEIPVQKPAQ